jgi:hypothetical protein
VGTVEIDTLIGREIERLTIQCGCSIDPFTQNLTDHLERLMDDHRTLSCEDEMLYRAKYRDNHLDLTEALEKIDLLIFSATQSIRTHHVFVQRLQKIRKWAVNDFRAYRCYTLRILARIGSHALL